MKQRSKSGGRRATGEMRVSLYSVFGKEHRGDAEFPANSSSPASSVTSGFCKSTAAIEVGRRRRRRSPDLEAVVNDRSDRFGSEVSTSTAGDVNSRQSTPSLSEISRDDDDNDSPEAMATEKQPEPAPPATVKTPPAFAAKTPSAAELEEFFTEAEEYVQKRFAEKYNFDVVKDAPILGGRYQWVRTRI